MTRLLTILVVALVVGALLGMTPPRQTRAYWQLPVQHVCSTAAPDGTFTWQVFMNAWDEPLSFTWEVLDDAQFSGETGGPIEVNPENDQFNPVYFTTPASGPQRVRITWSYIPGGSQTEPTEATAEADSYRCLIVEAVTNPAVPSGSVFTDIWVDEPSGPDFVTTTLMGFTPGDVRVLHGYGPGFEPVVAINGHSLNWAIVGYLVLDDPRDACPAVPAYGEDPSPYADTGGVAVALGDGTDTFTRKVCVATHAVPQQGGGENPGAPTFSLDKQPEAPQVVPGQRVGFLLTVTNTGDVPGFVEVWDGLPGGFDWRMEVPPSRVIPLVCFLEGSTLDCDPAALEPGQSAAILVVAPVPDGFCGPIVNRADYRWGAHAADGPWQQSNEAVVTVACPPPPGDGGQPTFDIVVRKRVPDDTGFLVPGPGWEFVIDGCGGERDGVTGADGTLRWEDIPVPAGCEYRVSEVTQRGWVVMAPGPVRFIGAATAGSEVVLDFVNFPHGATSPDEPAADEGPAPQPQPIPPPGPVLPEDPSDVQGPPGDGGGTTAPAPSPTQAPGDGTPAGGRNDDDVAGERATGSAGSPAATGTPKPPATGSGPGAANRDSGSPAPLALVVAGLLLLASTAVVLRAGRRR